MSTNSYADKLRQAVMMIESKGKEYARARAISWQLQEMRKVILADEARREDGTSMAEREMNARCTDAYKQHLEGTKVAIENEHTLKAECERWKCQWESVRSLLSLEKKTMETFQE